MAQYTIQAPDGNTITLEGPDGASQADVIARAQELYKPEKNRGNIINSDVPTVVGERPNAVNPVAPQKPRGMMDYAAGAVEPIMTMATGAVAQPVGAAYGLVKNAMSPEFGTQQGIQNAERAGGELANALTYQPRSQAGKDVLGAVGEAADAIRLPAYTPVIGQLPSLANVPGNAARALRSGVVKSADNVADMAAPVTSKISQALRNEPKVDIKSAAKIAPSLDDLATESDLLFDQAKNAGIMFKGNAFTQRMAEIGKDLRSEGYTPTAYPKITGVLEELTNPAIPKDFVELQALRKIIAGAQASNDGTERRLATKLKHDFDDFVINAPENMIASGSKEGLQAWKGARDTWARLSKSEIFTDMIEKAELDKSKYSMSGIENALTTQIRNLAKNDKKMRLFTAEEQEAIKQVAKGDKVDVALKLFGKLAPNNVFSLTLPSIAMGPITGAALGATGVAAKKMVSKKRTKDFENLAAYMRKGKTGGETPALDQKKLAEALTKNIIEKAKNQGK